MVRIDTFDMDEFEDLIITLWDLQMIGDYAVEALYAHMYELEDRWENEAAKPDTPSEELHARLDKEMNQFYILARDAMKVEHELGKLEGKLNID